MKNKNYRKKRYLSGNLKISDYIIIAVCLVGIISGCIGIFASSIDYVGRRMSILNYQNM